MWNFNLQGFDTEGLKEIVHKTTLIVLSQVVKCKALSAVRSMENRTSFIRD